MSHKGDKLVCRECGFDWKQRGELPPVSCPNCKSRNWPGHNTAVFRHAAGVAAGKKGRDADA